MPSTLLVSFVYLYESHDQHVLNTLNGKLGHMTFVQKPALFNLMSSSGGIFFYFRRHS